MLFVIVCFNVASKRKHLQQTTTLDMAMGIRKALSCSQRLTRLLRSYYV